MGSPPPKRLVLLRADDKDEGLSVREEIICTVSPVLKAILDNSSGAKEGTSSPLITAGCTKASIEAFVSLAGSNAFDYGQRRKKAKESFQLHFLRLSAAAMPMICKYEADGMLSMTKMLMHDSASKFLADSNTNTPILPEYEMLLEVICAFWKEHAGSQEGSNDWLGADELVRFLVKLAPRLAAAEKVDLLYLNMPVDLARKLARKLHMPSGLTPRKQSGYNQQYGYYNGQHNCYVCSQCGNTGYAQ